MLLKLDIQLKTYYYPNEKVLFKKTILFSMLRFFFCIWC